ncbi:predicted protein [Thalassiosira pseudonana CCMP1335]|uniref:Uncharacterized protein n=1 Tax=Thalassiosira pseudonana TaxID=35128 RepID=B8BS81_THAPS|nr:predicted protein [Thalassiosira pseudonana CCMP1335]EED96675.1 predicted protein [Thalassiosira pseudonana CCMP1335]|mmetsp:Transcript_16614/g.36026  ORF Transcript_16614/g.36026 Transcript_16614/m.36026 type:complete len:208 (+) Transcript_16614:59-682(+)|eukprot:g1569.t1 g1569   contig10:2354623-2355367(-)
MTKLPTLSLLLSTNILTVHGWIPRISTSLRYYGNQNDNGRARGHETQQQQRVLHSKKFDDDGGFDDASDGDYDFDEDHHFILFGDGSIHKAPAFISRLEAIYGMDTQVDLTSENDVDNIGTASTVTTTAKEPLWQDKGERTKIGDWMDMTEGPCLGDCCGDECDEQCDIPEHYKVFSSTNDKIPKVDVMSFLGIRRAEPLRVQRDWD